MTAKATLLLVLAVSMAPGFCLGWFGYGLRHRRGNGRRDGVTKRG